MYESRAWQNNTLDKLQDEQQELSLGPSRQVLMKLGKLAELMMEDEEHSDDEAKAMATLNDCFPVITGETGETEDKLVSEIAYLKYIPTHQEGDVTICHHYQARSISPDGEETLAGAINANWTR